MARAAIFTLGNSDLSAFLFAVVGTELNGSALTILSVLARLGHDPWTEAGRWARLPEAAATDCLAQSIAQMPLSPQGIADARATASRLTRLLPSQARAPEQTSSVYFGTLPIPNWAPRAAIYCALALGIGLNMMLMSKPAAVAATPTEHAVPATPQVPTSG